MPIDLKYPTEKEIPGGVDRRGDKELDGGRVGKLGTQSGKAPGQEADEHQHFDECLLPKHKGLKIPKKYVSNLDWPTSGAEKAQIKKKRERGEKMEGREEQLDVFCWLRVILCQHRLPYIKRACPAASLPFALDSRLFSTSTISPPTLSVACR